jgi:hypothetical protein
MVRPPRHAFPGRPQQVNSRGHRCPILFHAVCPFREFSKTVREHHGCQTHGRVVIINRTDRLPQVERQPGIDPIGWFSSRAFPTAPSTEGVAL